MDIVELARVYMVNAKKRCNRIHLLDLAGEQCRGVPLVGLEPLLEQTIKCFA